MNQTNDPLAQNLRDIRGERNLSLDKLADLTGVSKSMLRQIEKGQSSPTVSTLWKIANGLRLPFTSLLQEADTNVILKDFKSDAPLLGESAGYRLFPLVPFDPQRTFEIYYLEIDPNTKLNADPHHGTPEEYIFVFRGAIDITVDGDLFTVTTDQFISFRANCTHSYQNTGSEMAIALMLIAYV